MEEKSQSLNEEQKYLENTLNRLRIEIKNLKDLEINRKKSFISSGKEMWEDSIHHTLNFDRLVDMNQYLNIVTNKSTDYSNAVRQLAKYERMLESPYFGRLDFCEDGMECEKIYIGIHNFMDPHNSNIIVYDWRAPISGIFYQYELGNASYKAPYGLISGKVELKRQIKIKSSKLEYFFDSSVKIDDEMLQLVLSQNSSVKMRAIIETIQREQDIIIRDTENDLLIVQGVAGSGKTSIALHRIAYLLYFGLNSGLKHQNILIISPNAVFGRYISSVLPELGEDNVEQFIFDEYASDSLKSKGSVESREGFLESIITMKEADGNTLRQNLSFKGSENFIRILDNLVAYFERNIRFEDVYYDGKIIYGWDELKNIFLDNSINLPAAKRLKRIEQMILDKINPIQKKRLSQIEAAVQKMQGHDLEIKPFSRLLSIKQTKVFLQHLRRFTEVDFFSVYKMLFTKRELFYRLSQGIQLPPNIDSIISSTAERLERGNISYEDSMALLYVKLRIEGEEAFSDIRQVVVDEAQDYTLLQYQIFKSLFKAAKITVLGDISQTIEKDLKLNIYDSIEKIFNKKKSVKVFLNKSYRASYEINTFAKGILNNEQIMEPFERHEDKPALICRDTEKLLIDQMILDIKKYKEERFESLAIICKTACQAEELYSELKDKLDVRLVKANDDIEKGIMILPSYAAKGLEFDVVMVNDASAGNYKTDIDRRLLYIACTRALHRLALYYSGDISSFLMS